MILTTIWGETWGPHWSNPTSLILVRWYIELPTKRITSQSCFIPWIIAWINHLEIPSERNHQIGLSLKQSCWRLKEEFVSACRAGRGEEVGDRNFTGVGLMWIWIEYSLNLGKQLNQSWLMTSSSIVFLMSRQKLGFKLMYVKSKKVNQQEIQRV
jgi:hypothetical protein